MKKVDISGNDLGDVNAKIFSTCLHNVKILYANDCQLKPQGIESITNAIKQLPIPVSNFYANSKYAVSTS